MINITTNDSPHSQFYLPLITKAKDLWNYIIPYADPINIDFIFEELPENVMGAANPINFSLIFGTDINFGIYGLAETGEMSFNTEFYPLDIDSPYYKSFFPTVFHEMAHVLGFGALWNMPLTDFPDIKNQIDTYNPTYSSVEYINYVVDPNDDTKYIGKNALARWRKGMPGHENDTFVPLENEGGFGSYGSHWDDSSIDYRDYRNREFKYEIMTTKAEAEEVNGTLYIYDTFLSLMTVAALQDLLYPVRRLMGSTKYNLMIKEAIY